MPIKLRPYKLGSKSAKLLSSRLGVRRVGLGHDPRRSDIVINWGSSANYHFRHCYDLNNPSLVAIAGNKLKTFQRIKETVVDDILPEWTTDIEEAKDWVADGHKVYCRTLLTSCSGRGIVIAETSDQVVNAPLYTKHTKHKDEFRVHVFKGKVIDVTQKKKRSGSLSNPLIRNHSNGYVYCREGIVVPDIVKSASIQAVDAIGLDFAAVDIGYNYHRSKPFVFEINTAPGLDGTTLDRYISAINQHIREVS